MDDTPTVSDRIRALSDRFQSVVSNARDGRLKHPVAPPEPTEDEKLEAALVRWLSDDKPVLAALGWIDIQAQRANTIAHMKIAEPHQMTYALGQEAAYRAVAQRFRLIRGDTSG